MIVVYYIIELVCWKEGPRQLSSHDRKMFNLNYMQIMATVNLTKGGFLKRIADYESSTEVWKFLGDKPALIDFYASWCGPCKSLAPVLEELSKEYEGKVDIYKVNVDDEEELASHFHIRSVPTLMFVPITGNPHIATGAPTKAQLRKMLDAL